MRARRAKRGGIAQVNSMRADAPRITLAQVAAETRALLRRDGNYRRTALTVALMQTLLSVPVMILNYALMFTGGGVAQDAQTTMNIGNLFMMLMQALVAPALTLGLARYELNMYNGRPRSPMDLFEGLTRGSYFLSVRAMLWRALSMLVWVMIPMSLVLNEIAHGAAVRTDVAHVLAGAVDAAVFDAQSRSGVFAAVLLSGAGAARWAR